MGLTSILTIQPSQIASDRASFRFVWHGRQFGPMSALGVDQAEALLDAVQPGIGSVDPVLGEMLGWRERFHGGGVQ